MSLIYLKLKLKFQKSHMYMVHHTVSIIYSQSLKLVPDFCQMLFVKPFSQTSQMVLRTKESGQISVKLSQNSRYTMLYLICI